MSERILPNTSPDGQAPASAQTTADALNIALTRKAEIETKLAELALSPLAQRRQFLAALAGIGGVAVALATLITGIVAGINYFEELNKERKLRVEVQVNDAVTQLSSGKAADHAAAVTTLGFFISKDPKMAARNKRIVMAVANAIPGERDFFARRSMVEFFNTMDYSALDLATKSQTMQALVSYDRSLTADATLHRENTEAITEADRETLRILNSLTTVIARLATNGGYVADMSNLFLADTSFRHAQLKNVDFSNSILAYSDFTGAELSGARFENTDIEGTKFRAAHLSDATFTYRNLVPIDFMARRHHSHYYDIVTRYRDYDFIDEFARKFAKAGAELPTFDCADLSGATITGLPFEAFSPRSKSDNQDEHGRFRFIKFRSANLQDAVLKPVFFYARDTPIDLFSLPASWSTRFWRPESKASMPIYLLMPNYTKRFKPAERVNIDDPNYIVAAFLDGMFDKSNWTKAKVAPWVRDFMEVSEQNPKSKGTERVRDPRYCSN